MFLVRPRPQPFESLSSWRQRCGLDNGFQRFPAADGCRLPHDPDRMPSIEDQNWLINHLAVEYSDIQAMSLEPNLLRTQRRSEYNPQWRWLLPTGSKATPPVRGPVVCTQCLREAGIPYFRTEWRFAFLNDCPIHGIAMIDQCPCCNFPLWPAAIHRISPDRPLKNLAACANCGFDLRNEMGCDSGGSGLARDLWHWYCNGTGPDRFAVQCGFGDYLDGIYVLVQLFLRRHSRKILSVLPPLDLPLSAGIGDIPPYIEACAIGVRRALLDRAVWLLDEWPSRFLENVQKGSLSRTHFMMTSLDFPKWLSEIVDRELTIPKRSTPVQVATAIEQIAQRGEPVTKSAVRRELGVTESRAADEALSRREHARVDELLTLCRKFEKMISTTPEARAQYASLVRDYTIFLVSLLRQESVDVTCRLDHQSVRETIVKASDGEPAEVAKLIRQRARDLNEEYATTIRPAWTTTVEQENNWFISRFGEPFEGHSLRERVAKMMRTGFPNDLWRSSDVFISVLGVPKQGRRAERNFPEVTPGLPARNHA